MGSGKSCLSHVVIEDVKKNINSSSRKQLAYFYINGTEARTTPGDYTTTILRCLLKQLADLGSGEKLYEGVVQAYEKQTGRPHLSKDESVQLISRCIHDFQDTTIVIDGLDECTEESQAELTECLYDLLESSKASRRVLKIFIASRPEQHIEDHLERLEPSRLNVADNNIEDIHRLIDGRVENGPRRYRRLYRREEHGCALDQVQAVKKMLQENAQGMFRWVEIALNYLHSSRTYMAMQERLQKLHKLDHLFDLYDEIYRVAKEALDEPDRTTLRMTLTLMLYAEPRWANHAPLIVAAAQLVAARPTSAASYQTREIAGLCPSFLVTIMPHAEKPEDMPGIGFPHFSVREYLLTRRYTEYNIANGHGYLAMQCIRCFTDRKPYERGRELERLNSNLFGRYAAGWWLDHLATAFLASDRSWSDLSDSSSLRSCVEAMLLESPAPASFSLWLEQPFIPRHTFMHRLGVLTAVAPAKPVSTLAARLPLGLNWRDSRFTLEQLNATWEYRNDIDRNFPGMLELPVMVRDVEAIKWLVEMGVEKSLKFAPALCWSFAMWNENDG